MDEAPAGRNHPLTIPDTELVFSFSRSGGPGGQNVNKRNTKARLLFDVTQSVVLTDMQKQRILSYPRLAHLIIADGVIAIVTQIHSTQLQNKETAWEQLHMLIREALVPVKRRVRVRPPRHKKNPNGETKPKTPRAGQSLRAHLSKGKDVD
jgi:ribosome-associated protein